MYSSHNSYVQDSTNLKATSIFDISELENQSKLKILASLPERDKDKNETLNIQMLNPTFNQNPKLVTSEFIIFFK